MLFCLSAHAEFATAVELIVEAVLFKEFVATLLESAFAPIAIIKVNAFHLALCPFSCLVDLWKRFPSARGEGSGKLVNAELFCFLCCSKEAHLEALQASLASFGFVFKSTYVTEPKSVVVVVVYDVEPKLVCVFCNLIFPYVILFFWVYVRIAIEDCGAHIIGKHPLYDCA